MSELRGWKLVCAGVALSSMLLAGCATVDESASQDTSGSSGGGEVAQRINGAGSSFVAPFMDSVAGQLAQEEGIEVNYQSIGSSGGREQFIQKTVAFGASDEPMSDEEMQEAGGNPLHIAAVGGAVVPVYNLEGVESGLNFTGEVLADIYLGNITRWNDPAIAELNPDAQLPDAKIAVVHRSDGSGTTNIWTSYLAAVSPKWESGPGAGGEIKWPTGIGGDGNEGVAGLVKQTPNSIGYVGLEYAVQNDLTYGNVGEQGAFVEPSVESARAAIAAVGDEIPEDLRFTVSSANPQGEGVYPITGLTWVLVRQQMDDLAQCKAVARTAWYLTHEGQELAPDLNYVPLPENIVSRDEELIRSMEAEGQKCYTE
ncbi:phosphate-binding protein [Rubrobacter xylanophilus]|uniref:Phosphate-binding protein n=1 Tax=Rubrobacter xylanophilus TaxID=49319 RepID=A0A510HHV9_9ACTN|nr:phosphate ABC transporter substrate-binding protein PstS [Rubrobacter xylanophilus]BBL78243.1 phosphate-binding protein [Rubrobacter xylanophilus]